ncbi:MAG: AbrB/MazE/SpoVT family DNA-binding domain-containing protein [Bacilli bacterium]|nr:AbrB/MazE/SpoVT family DNA-binding domain-containing protein [Bacilli bacterium]
MKATGVVRRIDDLGRIVIPKELRRTLKIRDGEFLEIFVESDSVILKKYSSFSDIKNVCDRIVSSVNLDGKTLVIVDNDKVISSTNSLLIDKKISDYCSSVLENREVKIENDNETIELFDLEVYKQNFIVSPIISNSDLVGGVIIFSKEMEVNDFDKNICEFLVKFLIKNIE